MTMRFSIGRPFRTAALAVAVFVVCAARAETVDPVPVTGDAAGAVRQLLEDGKYADAEVAARTHLVATEAATGCESLETAEALELLAESLWRGGKALSEGAAALAEQAVAIKEKALGSLDQRVSDSLVHAANVHGTVGNNLRERELEERALEISTELWGPDDRRVALIHHNLGYALYETDAREAERHWREALRIYETVAGPESLDIAYTLGALATCASDRGDFVEAEAAYKRAIGIQEVALGPRHPSVAIVYNNLGYLHQETGDYEQARAELRHALSIREEKLGPEHESTMMNLGNLAILDARLGLPATERWEELIALADRVLGPDHPLTSGFRANYAVDLSEVDPERSRRLTEAAYATFTRSLGPEHPRTLWTLSNLGEAALRAGDLETAERLLRQAIAGLEKETGAPVGLLLNVRQILARCRAERGAASEAKSLFAQVLASQEKLNGPEHPAVATSLVEYGDFLRQERDLPGARASFERALAIREKSLGPDHPAVGDSLVALADLETEIGEIDTALGHFRRGIAIQEKARSPEDPRNAKGYRDYAACLLRKGESDAALEAALKAEEITTRQLRATLAGVPERQALGLVAKAPSALGLAVSAAVALRQADSSTRVLDALVRSRALVFDEMSQRQRVLRDDDGGEAAGLFAAWVAARDRLARLTVLGEDEKSPQRYRARLEKARAEKDAAERALADRSWEFRHERTRDAAGLAEVTGALPPGGALVAFVRYAQVPRARSGVASAAAEAPADAYAAFVLRNGAGAPVVVPLGPASAIDAAARSVRDSMALTASSLGGPGGTPTASYRRLASTLADLAWRPLQPHLAGTRTAFVVPDGSLQLVSFAALPADGDAWLLEKGPVLHYLSAERDLVGAEKAAGRGLLAAGAPDFDSAPVTVASANTPRLRGPEPADTAAPVHRGPPPSCRSFTSLRFPALPASLVELEEVAGIWRETAAPGTGKGASAFGTATPLVLSGAAATERAVKASAPGRQIVHLTTHGFFLGDCATAPAGGKARPGPAPGSSVYAENPLLLSGLAFAGANRRGEVSAGAEDGILTAEEVASLDLTGVSWAVLSACESGLGEARAGEGLFGLRRAFQVAGARTLVTSLWPVEDEASRRWMKALYEGRLARGLDTARAVHEAGLAVLRERRAAGLSDHPFFWAGFVAAGDWR